MSQENFQVDLTNCDREPIHIPGLVQEHGVLIALDNNFQIQQISENSLLHFGQSAEPLLHQSLESLIGADYLKYLQAEIEKSDLEGNPLYLRPVRLNEREFEVMAHQSKGVLILEFELPVDSLPPISRNSYSQLRSKLVEINNTRSVADFCSKAANAVRAFTGFDRVMIYQFLEDDSGHVIAEAAREDLSPFLGLRYPASDIPKQARALYLKQVLRFKVDVDDAPAPIVPTLNSQTDAPLDLSFAATRAMSPIHIEYLKNMSVAASLSISIIRDGKLWGLIACHHGTPRYIPHEARMSAEFLAHMIALQIDSKASVENYEYLTRLNDYQQKLVAELDETPNIPHLLIAGQNNLLTSVKCTGAALILGDEIHLVGITPGEPSIQKLIEWLWKNQNQEVFATNQISKFLPEAASYAAQASGVLAVRLTPKAPEYLIWFRAEETETVSWAGNPEKPVTVGQFGTRLTPRKSFEIWQSEVRGQAAKWQQFEIDFAATLRRTMVEIILRRFNELVDLNRQLQMSNTELDSFAYVASHDLKEPLRGINNYSTFLLEDYSKNLDAEAIERLETLVRLSARMENLLDSLLHYSRVGRIDLQKREIDLGEVLSDALLFMRNRIEQDKAEIIIPRPLPTVLADEVRTGEIFSNLISNGLKYNNQSPKQIEIGYLENEQRNITGEPKIEQIFYVRDNGIGIDKRYHADIFRIFKRLHGRNEYTGGVGAGLTIVKKIVERHGGRIWLDSKPGEGTTFYFTLEPDTI